MHHRLCLLQINLEVKKKNLLNAAMSSLTYSQASKKLFTISFKSLFGSMIYNKNDSNSVSSQLKMLAYIQIHSCLIRKYK